MFHEYRWANCSGKHTHIGPPGSDGHPRHLLSGFQLCPLTPASAHTSNLLLCPRAGAGPSSHYGDQDTGHQLVCAPLGSVCSMSVGKRGHSKGVLPAPQPLKTTP